jgi:hypothetical protein
MTYLPLRGLYHNLSIGVVWSFSWPGGDSYILALGFPCKPSIRTASHFPCSIGLYFSSVSKESDLRVNGCFHQLDFCVFFELFSSVFRVRLVPSILGCFGSDLLVGIMDSCPVHLCA